MSDTWTALQLARDAWDSGRLSESYRLMPEPDFEYDRCSVRRLTAPRFFVDTGPDEYDYEDWDPLPMAEQIAAHRAEVRAIDWLAWREEPPPLTTTDLDGLYRVMYPAEAIESMAMAQNPFVATLKGDVDGIETRVKYWANLVVSAPNTFIPVEGDE